MEENFRHLGEADCRLHKATKEWHNRIGDMLAYVNDVLSPRGSTQSRRTIASLRRMLSRRR